MRFLVFKLTSCISSIIATTTGTSILTQVVEDIQQAKNPVIVMIPNRSLYNICPQQLIRFGTESLYNFEYFSITFLAYLVGEDPKTNIAPMAILRCKLQYSSPKAMMAPVRKIMFDSWA